MRPTASSVWVSHSPALKPRLAAVAVIALGGLLIGLTGHAAAAGSHDQQAAFALGLLLLAIGLGVLLTVGSQTLTVDPCQRRISVRDDGLWRRRETVVRFDEVERVAIGTLGHPGDGSRMHHLVLILRDGREVPLFAPGRFYPGAGRREVAEARRERLQALLQSPSRG